MDLTAEFYLETVDSVFVREALPNGQMMHRGRRVDPGRIRHVPLMTVEGEKDDITGLGQCHAAHKLCCGLAESRKYQFTCPGVGHYGVFNGSRFRADIAPRIAQFVRINDPRAEFIPLMPAIERRNGVQSSSARHVNEPSLAAFTFEPANDTGPDPYVERRRRGAAHGAEAEAQLDSSPQTTPFRLWAMAGSMMIDGVFRLHGTNTRRDG